MSTNASTPINVSDVIDGSRLGPFQLLVLGICTLCMIVDGFDVQSMGYVAPALIKDWAINKATLGPIFGAALLGMLIGSMSLTLVADKLGRRPVLICAIFVLALCMFLTAHADSVDTLLRLRLATGFAMGAVVPNAVALAGEYSPARVRVTAMMIVSSGFIVGGALGGAFAGALMPTYGWRSVFYAGAIAPLVLGVLMVFALPESLRFLTVRAVGLERVRRWLRRIDDRLELRPDTPLTANEAAAAKLPLTELFREGRLLGTVLLWAMNFMNMLAAYFLSSWLPAVMSEAGHSTGQAVMAGTALWAGGIVGNLLLGWIVDRRGFNVVLLPTFLTAAVAIAGISQVYGTLALAIPAIALAGFCVLGGQCALNALGATFYPTAARSTGMGWAMGLGRAGAIVGPMVGGELLRLHWATSHLLAAAAVPILLAGWAAVMFAKSVGAGTRRYSSATEVREA